MTQNLSTDDFTCPQCHTRYKVVRAELDPQNRDKPVQHGLPSADGRHRRRRLKYFWVSQTPMKRRPPPTWFDAARRYPPEHFNAWVARARGRAARRPHPEMSAPGGS
jgi:predicted Zn finger-like uncharacterized protein